MTATHYPVLLTATPDPVLRTAWQHGPGKELVVDPGRPQRHHPAAGRRPGELEPVLREALAPTRWDDWSHYNAHRPFPSARARQAHRCWLVLADGPHRVDEERVEIAMAATGRDDEDGPCHSDAGVERILVAADPDAVPHGYGALRAALAALETGHVVESLVVAARRHGWQPTVQWQPGRPERPELQVTMTRHAVCTPPPRPRRCSGLDPRGLSADPRPLPAATWDALVAGVPTDDGMLRHRLAVHNVEGRADGVWTRGVLRPGTVGPTLARAFRGPQGVADIAGLNTVWGISADVRAACAADPVAGYARLLVEAGRAGQRVAHSAAAAGLFCRPVRGVDEPDAEAALGLPPNEDLLYTLLIGRPRVHGFSYDLTPCPADGGAP